jgi:uncharacterized phiE125 gp8 family phage protein
MAQSEHIITAPAAQPLDVIEARLHVRRDDVSDDVKLKFCITAARNAAEMRTARQLVAARWRATLDSFVGYKITLQKSPVMLVESIQYVAIDGTTQTVPSTDYKVDYSAEPCRITPIFGKIWPVPLPQIGSVTVTYLAGFAAPFTVSGNNISASGWKPLAVGDALRLSNSGGVLPAPLKEETDYTVNTIVSPGIYTLALAGTPVTLTDSGTGTSFIGVVPESVKAWMLYRIGSLYENREEVLIVDRGRMENLPYIDSLLDADTVVTY